MMDEGILIGMILGDGHLRPYTNSASLVIGHSPKQKEYLLHKLKLLNLPYSINSYDTISNGKPYCPVIAVTKSSSYLLNLRKIVYPNGKKRITYEILTRLNPTGLAIWYFDDGNYYDGSIRLSTNCFDYSEHLLIKEYLNQLGINVDIRPSKHKYYQLYFNHHNTSLFLKLIYPVCVDFPDSIKYKLGHMWCGNKERLILMHKRKLENTKRFRENHRDTFSQYYLANKEKIKLKSKQYYQNHRESILKKNKQYSLNHKEEIKQNKRGYYQRNKDKIYASTQLWAKSNPDKVSFYKKKYRDTHKQEQLERQRIWRAKQKGIQFTKGDTK